MPRIPLQIGVTGGIGSGKSLVCRIFACLGVPVYSADDRAKWLIENHSGIRSDLITLFGPDVYDGKGKYNRVWVSSRVFGNKELLQQLNGIVHPRVGEDTEHWVREHSSSPYVLKEAALMNRAGEGNSLDAVIVVQASMETRIRRTLARDVQRSRTEVERIISQQMADADRLAIADFIVDNDDQIAVIPQVVNIHHNVLQRSGYGS